MSSLAKSCSSCSGIGRAIGRVLLSSQMSLARFWGCIHASSEVGGSPSQACALRSCVAAQCIRMCALVSRVELLQSRQDVWGGSGTWLSMKYSPSCPAYSSSWAAREVSHRGAWSCRRGCGVVDCGPRHASLARLAIIPDGFHARNPARHRC